MDMPRVYTLRWLITHLSVVFTVTNDGCWAQCGICPFWWHYLFKLFRPCILLYIFYFTINIAFQAADIKFQYFARVNLFLIPFFCGRKNFEDKKYFFTLDFYMMCTHQHLIVYSLALAQAIYIIFLFAIHLCQNKKKKRI